MHSTTVNESSKGTVTSESIASSSSTAFSSSTASTANDYPLTTRLSKEDAEALRLIGELDERSSAALVRIAVREYIERQTHRVYPLSLRDAQSLSVLLSSSALLDVKNEPLELVSKAALLMNVKNYGGAGVYLLINGETKELYVGSSVDLTARFAHHRHTIMQGEHKNTALREWTLDTVVVLVLETHTSIESSSLRKREQAYIDALKQSTNIQWTLVNEAVAASSTSTKGSNRVVSNKSVAGNKEVNTDVEDVSPAALLDVEQEEEESLDLIRDCILPILQEENGSMELSRLLDKARLTGELERCVQFIREYESPWLKRLHASGRFPWLTMLFE